MKIAKDASRYPVDKSDRQVIPQDIIDLEDSWNLEDGSVNFEFQIIEHGEYGVEYFPTDKAKALKEELLKNIYYPGHWFLIHEDYQFVFQTKEKLFDYIFVLGLFLGVIQITSPKGTIHQLKIDLSLR